MPHFPKVINYISQYREQHCLHVGRGFVGEEGLVAGVEPRPPHPAVLPRQQHQPGRLLQLGLGGLLGDGRQLGAQLRVQLLRWGRCLELETKVKRRFAKISQSRRRLLQGPFLG